MTYRKYTKELLSPIVKQSQSVRQVIIALGLKETGGNYSHIAKMIDQLGIDRSHFLGQGHNKGKKPVNYKQTIEYLNDYTKINSSDLRNRLLREKFFTHQCMLCNLSEWLGKPIPLELHHIDNNHFNNHIQNLQVLCCNCHKHVHDLK